MGNDNIDNRDGEISVQELMNEIREIFLKGKERLTKSDEKILEGIRVIIASKAEQTFDNIVLKSPFTKEQFEEFFRKMELGKQFKIGTTSVIFEGEYGKGTGIFKLRRLSDGSRLNFTYYDVNPKTELTKTIRIW